MNLKKLTLGLLLVLVAITTLISCKKQEDESVANTALKKDQIANTWIEFQVIRNGTVDTSFYPDTYTFYENEDFVFDKWDHDDGLYHKKEGKWSLVSDDKIIRLNYNDSNNYSENWGILRLEEKEMWLKNTIEAGNITWTKEIHLKEK